MIGQCMLTEDTFHGSLIIPRVHPQCCYGFVLKRGKNNISRYNIDISRTDENVPSFPVFD